MWVVLVSLLPYISYFSSPCSSHTGSSNLAKAYQESLHMTWAPAVCLESRAAVLCVCSSLKLQLWWGLLCKTAPATLPQVPRPSHSITSPLYLLHWLITLLLMRLLALCRAAALGDTLQEEKNSADMSTSTPAMPARNTHLINICSTDKPKV